MVERTVRVSELLPSDQESENPYSPTRGKLPISVLKGRSNQTMTSFTPELSSVAIALNVVGALPPDRLIVQGKLRPVSTGAVVSPLAA